MITSMIIEPTLALIRAQLGFRIQVRAECGNSYHLLLMLLAIVVLLLLFLLVLNVMG